MAKEGISRRSFIKGTVAATGAVALAGLSATEVQAKGGVPKKWNAEADVVVLGFGGAGACAAIEAAMSGAKVLVLEKQAEGKHISNTRMSGGIYHCPDPTGDRKALKEYAKAMFSGENIPWKLEGEQPEWSDGLAEA
jgi:choline dehydrogenase-like flavoprotein